MAEQRWLRYWELLFTSLWIGETSHVLVQLFVVEIVARLHDTLVDSLFRLEFAVHVELVTVLELTNFLVAIFLHKLVVLEAGEEHSHLLQAGHIRCRVRLAAHCVLEAQWEYLLEGYILLVLWRTSTCRVKCCRYTHLQYYRVFVVNFFH